jgi:hypothetical protein
MTTIKAGVDVRATRVSPPPAAAVALTAFRELPDGRARQYTEAWTEHNPYQGCERFIRMCGAIGYLQDSQPEHAYAVLDAVSADGDILATYDIPHARAFQFIYRKLHLRVAETDGVASTSTDPGAER